MASILDGLTPSQRDVLRLLATGMRNSEIAEQRGCSEKAITWHVRNILRKFEARNRVEVAVRYVRETEQIAAPTVVTRIVERLVERPDSHCPSCAIRRLAVAARNAGLHVIAISDRGVRVATSRRPTGILLHDEQDMTDLCAELAEAA